MLSSFLYGQRVEPYAPPPRSNGSSESKSVSGVNLSLQVENSVKAGIGRLSVSQSSDPVAKENKILPSKFFCLFLSISPLKTVVIFLKPFIVKAM